MFIQCLKMQQTSKTLLLTGMFQGLRILAECLQEFLTLTKQLELGMQDQRKWMECSKAAQTSIKILMAGIGQEWCGMQTTQQMIVLSEHHTTRI